MESDFRLPQRGRLGHSSVYDAAGMDAAGRGVGAWGTWEIGQRQLSGVDGRQTDGVLFVLCPPRARHAAHRRPAAPRRLRDGVCAQRYSARPNLDFWQRLNTKNCNNKPPHYNLDPPLRSLHIKKVRPPVRALRELRSDPNR
eukprot:5044444-Prymnesium_polylepis.1